MTPPPPTPGVCVSKGRLPNSKCKLEYLEKCPDGYEVGFHRDSIGNVFVTHWKFGYGFDKNRETRLSPKHIRKLRDYLNKIIEYQERK